MTITAAEQYLIELINRARLDPMAEAARYGIGLNDGVGTPITPDPKQVLAPNALLEAAAQAHSEWMLATNDFDHQGAGGSDPGDRMEAAGYQFTGSWTWGENIAWRGTTGALNLETVIAEQHRDLFLSAGHRENLMNAAFREIGVAQVEGPFLYQGVTYNSSMLTENFAKSGGAVFVTGVVYRDLDDDDFYTIGEGAGGLTFSAGGGSDTSESAGGYAVSVSPQSNLLVTVSQGAASAQVRVDASSGNVKLDLTDDHGFMSDKSLELVSGVSKARLLGIGDADLTGNDASNTLMGNAGDNTITGAGGRDKIMAGAGDDIIIAGAGDDQMIGDEGNDTIYGGDGIDLMMGGAGNDVIDGGDGLDVILGDGGSDILTGGLGTDYFVFATGFGTDRITDFEDGDRIHVGLVEAIVDWDDLLQNHLSQTAEGARISDGASSIILEGVDMATLAADDFAFSTNSLYV